MRTCIKCGKELDEYYFYKRKDGRTRHVCKKCVRDRLSYTSNCRVIINTHILMHYWNELFEFYRFVGDSEFKGDVILDKFDKRTHHKLLKGNAYIRILDNKRCIHEQKFKFTTSCIHWLENRKTCDINLAKD